MSHALGVEKGGACLVPFVKVRQAHRTLVYGNIFLILVFACAAYVLDYTAITRIAMYLASSQ